MIAFALFRKGFRVARWGAISLLVLLGAFSASGKRPNIVLVISDDHRADWMGHKGHPLIETPNLDRLAAEGVSFKNAFACSGVCSPSRASILTGRYAHRASAPEIIWKNNSFLKNQRLFVENLKAVGYRTAYVGKLHQGDDELPKPGFDEWIGFPFVGNFFDQPLWINGKRTSFSGFTDDNIAALAVERIKVWSEVDQPYCLIVGLKAPHIPFQYPERMKDRFTDVEFPRLATWEMMKPGLKGHAISAHVFPPAIQAYGNFQKWIKSYSRLSLTIDESVGALVKALESTGQMDDTFFVYTSDQGYSLGEFELCEKHYAYEQIMRIPMIVRYPRWVPAGFSVDSMVLTLDIAPTFLEAANALPLDGMDGRSWRPLFREQEVAWRDAFFFDFWSEWSDALVPMQAIRTDRYKMIHYQKKPIRELYDLKKDPHEIVNLYGRSGYESIQSGLESRFEAMKEEIGYTEREVQLLPHCYFVGPLTADDEVKLKRVMLIEGANIAVLRSAGFEIRKLGQPFDLEGLGLGEGSVYYALVPIERNTNYDPYVTLEFFAAGDAGKWVKRSPAMAAYWGGEEIWRSRPYAKLMGERYEPMERFARKCNFPLGEEKNLAVFRGVYSNEMPRIQAEIIAAKGTISF